MSTHDTSTNPVPWWAYPILVTPRRIAANLERVRAAGLVDRVPNLWQLAQGVLRMHHRLIFRSDTIGTSAQHPVRPTWRARLLQYRPLRFPFLLAERAIAPLDLTGLASSPERIIRHLLGAHHDGSQFVFDLQILSVYPGALDALHREVDRVTARDDARSRWLRDLTVFEAYHDNLAAEVERALEEGIALSDEEASDPDLSFTAYLDWCARQPSTPRESIRAWLARSLPRRGEGRGGGTSGEPEPAVV